jgi:FKBP-type peptidyl-prolyl cis-trans isomerase
VATHYRGYFLDGSPFDSSYDRGEPLEFTTAAGQMIPGYDLMVQDMAVGEKRSFVLPPDQAYGSRGAGGVIPPNAYIVFDVELVSVK